MCCFALHRVTVPTGVCRAASACSSTPCSIPLPPGPHLVGLPGDRPTCRSRSAWACRWWVSTCPGTSSWRPPTQTCSSLSTPLVRSLGLRCSGAKRVDGHTGAPRLCCGGRGGNAPPLTSSPHCRTSRRRHHVPRGRRGDAGRHLPPPGAARPCVHHGAAPAAAPHLFGAHAQQLEAGRSRQTGRVVLGE